VENVVKAFIGGGVLDGQDILRLFHDGQLGSIALGVAANGAGVGLGDVKAGGTEINPLFEGKQGFREGFSFFLRGAEEVKNDALGALGPDAGEFTELLNQPADGVVGGRDGVLLGQVNLQIIILIVLYHLASKKLYCGYCYQVKGQKSEVICVSNKS
jgi:hypothetical protein